MFVKLVIYYTNAILRVDSPSWTGISTSCPKCLLCSMTVKVFFGLEEALAQHYKFASSPNYSFHCVGVQNRIGQRNYSISKRPNKLSKERSNILIDPLVHFRFQYLKKDSNGQSDVHYEFNCLFILFKDICSFFL